MSSSATLPSRSVTTMQIYKVWSGDRSMKKSIACKNSDSIQNIIDKACQKLGVLTAGAQLVLEEDGTEVDDVDVLESWCSKVFVLLKKGEQWTERSGDSSFQHAGDTSCMASTSVHPEVNVGQHLAAGQLDCSDISADDATRNTVPLKRKHSPIRTAAHQEHLATSADVYDFGESSVDDTDDQVNIPPKRRCSPRNGSQSASFSTPHRQNVPGHDILETPLNTTDEMSRTPAQQSSHKRTILDHFGSSSSTTGKVAPFSSRRNVRETQKHVMTHGSKTKKRKSDKNDDTAENCYQPLPFQGKILAKHNVTGIAHLNSKLYVVHARSSTISVYSSIPPFQRNECDEIAVTPIREPRDIAAGRATSNKLYIMDYDGNSNETVSDGCKCIWSADPIAKAPNFVCLVKLDGTGTLSVMNNGNLLVTDWLKQVLEVYSHKNGQRLQSMALKSVVNPLHAVETSDKKFIVSCGLDAHSPNKVLQVTASGKKICASFGGRKGTGCGPGELNNPSHLALLLKATRSSGFHRVFVADENNSRVVVLDNRLHLDQIWQVEDGKPHRICCAERNGFVFIGTGHIIYICDIKNMTKL